MNLDEWKTNLAFEYMRKVASELGLREGNPEQVYPHLSKIDPDFFACWQFGKRTGAILYNSEHGFTYIPPKSSLTRDSVDNWQVAFQTIVSELNPKINLMDSPEWVLRLQSKSDDNN